MSRSGGDPRRCWSRSADTGAATADTCGARTPAGPRRRERSCPAELPPQPWARSPFPPIAEYAFLSDCEVTCLVAPNGAVEWMCLPRPDSLSVFTTMLDRSAGAFRLGPYDEKVPAARRYMPGSLMVETTWQDPGYGEVVAEAPDCDVTLRLTTDLPPYCVATAPAHRA